MGESIQLGAPKILAKTSEVFKTSEVWNDEVSDTTDNDKDYKKLVT